MEDRIQSINDAGEVDLVPLVLEKAILAVLDVAVDGLVGLRRAKG